MSDEGFLSRWSRRKRAAAAEARSDDAPPLAASVPPVPAASPPAPSGSTQPGPPAPLPPVESLSIESDLAPFMAKEVDPSLQRAALRKLFEDERFNVMDGLDVYIDDYTKPAPIPPEWYERMAQMAYLGDAAPKPPETSAQADGEPSPPASETAETGAAPEADISHNDVSADEAPVVPRDGACG